MSARFQFVLGGMVGAAIVGVIWWSGAAGGVAEALDRFFTGEPDETQVVEELPPPAPMTGTLAVSVSFFDAADSDQYWVYVDGQIVGRRHPSDSGPFDIMLMPGTYTVEIGLQASTVPAADPGRYRTLNKPLFFIPEDGVQVTQGARTEVDFLAPAKVRMLDQEDDAVICRRGGSGWVDEFNRQRDEAVRALEDFQADPAWASLREVQFSFAASPPSRSSVFIDLADTPLIDTWRGVHANSYYWIPSDLEDEALERRVELQWRNGAAWGPREYDSRQVRLMVDWLDRRYWGWFSGDPQGFQSCFGPVPEEGMERFRGLNSTVERSRDAIRRLTDIADKLDAVEAASG